MEHPRQVVYLDDGEMAVLTPDGFHPRPSRTFRWTRRFTRWTGISVRIEKGGFDHFMLKEIFEHRSGRNSIRGRLNLRRASRASGGLNMTPEEMREIRRVSSSVRLRGTRNDRRVHAEESRASR